MTFRLLSPPSFLSSNLTFDSQQRKKSQKIEDSTLADFFEISKNVT